MSGGPGRFPRLAASIRYNAYGQALQAALPFFTTPFIVHRLGPEAYGLLALVWTLVSQLNLLGLGASPAAVKHLAELPAPREPGRAGSILGAALSVNGAAGLAGLALLFALEPLLAGRVLDMPTSLRPAAGALFAFGGAAFLAQSLASVYAAAPRALQRFDVVNAGETGASALAQLGSCALLALGLGVRELAAWQAAVAGLGLAYFAAWARRLLPGAPLGPSADRAVLGRLLRFGGTLTVVQVAWSVLHQFDKVVVGAYVPIERLADYIIAFGLASKLQLVLGPVWPVLLPFASGLAGDAGRPTARRLLASGTKVALLLLAPLAALGFAFGPAFLELWLGGRYSEHAGWPLRWLLLGHLASGLAVFAVPLAQGVSSYRGPAALFAALSLAAAAAWPFVLPRWGPAGAAAVFCAAHCLHTGVMLWWTCRLLDAPLGALGTALLRPALGAVLLGAACFPLRNALRDWASLGLFCSAAAALWAGAAWRWGLDDEERGRLRQAASA